GVGTRFPRSGKKGESKKSPGQQCRCAAENAERREDAELEFKPKIEGNNAEAECQHRHERAEHGEHDGDGGFPRQALDTSMPTGRSSVATINGALSSPRRRCFYLATLNEKTESAGSPCVNILILLVTGYGSPPFPFDRNTLGSNGS